MDDPIRNLDDTYDLPLVQLQRHDDVVQVENLFVERFPLVDNQVGATVFRQIGAKGPLGEELDLFGPGHQWFLLLVEPYPHRVDDFADFLGLGFDGAGPPLIGMRAGDVFRDRLVCSLQLRAQLLGFRLHLPGSGRNGQKGKDQYQADAEPEAVLPNESQSDFDLVHA